MRLGRGDHEGGAAVVEFALVIPVLLMLIVGMVSSGILYNQQLQLTHATREGARYGATVPEDQAFSNGDTWANNVRDLVVERSAGELQSAQVCVALVEGPTSTEPIAAVSPDHVTGAPAGQDYCYDDSGGGESAKRVQVKVDRPGQLDAVFFKMDVDLGAKASARHESNGS